MGLECGIIQMKKTWLFGLTLFFNFTNTYKHQQIAFTLPCSIPNLLHPSQLIILWHDTWKLQSARLLGAAQLSTFPWQHRRRRCWTANCWNTFPSNKCDWRSNALHIESRRFLGNTCRNVSVHTATNLQSTVTAKNEITLLLKEVISIQFDQNLPQGENWPTEGRIRQNTEDKQKSEEERSEVFILCGVVTEPLECYQCL
jgi:hypothetical protein